MNTLLPNPNGCSRFEQNVFKKEKCKHCGFSWKEHRGAISEDAVRGFLESKQQAEKERQLKEAAEKQQAMHKKLALKRQNQAVEDKWYFNVDKDEDVPEATDSEDDEGGFCMQEFHRNDAVAPQPPKPVERPMILRNLIDFSECNVADPNDASIAAEDTEGTVPAPEDAPCFVPEAIAQPPQMSVPRMKAPEEELLVNEIAHLRQLLVDAGEEKKIEIDIIREEAVEKQQRINDLAKRCEAADARAAEAEARGAEKQQLVDELAEKLAQKCSRAEAEADAQAAEKQQQVDELAEKLAQKCNWAEVQLRMKQQRIDELEAKVAEGRQQLDDLMEKVKSMGDEAAKGRSQIEDPTSKCAVVEAQTQCEPQLPCKGTAAAPIEPAHIVSADTAARIQELLVLCSRTRQALGDSVGAGTAERGGPHDVDASLADLKEAIAAVHTVAVRADESSRYLARELWELTGKRANQFGPGQGPASAPAAATPCPPAVKMLQQVRFTAERQLVRNSKGMVHSRQEVHDAWRNSWWIRGGSPQHAGACS